MRYAQTLQFRLAVLLLLAVLPAAVLMVISSEATNRNTRAFKSAAIEQVAKLVADGERLRLKKVAQILDALSVIPLTGSSGQCGGILRSSQAIEPDIRDVGVVRKAGGQICATQRNEGQLDWEKVLGRLPPAAWTSEEPSFAVGRENSLIAVPKTLDDGSAVLILGLVRYRPPGLQARETVFRDGVDIVLVTTDGEVVGEVPAPIASMMEWFEKGPGPGGGVPAARHLNVSTDREYLYVFAPVHGTGAGILIGGMRDSLFGSERWRLWSSLGISLAILMIVVATAWIGVNKLVLRWIQKLRRAAGSYANGHLADRVTDVGSMPAGIAEFAQTFNRMADAIDERSSELEQSLREKSDLLRELHHRVKNNFQVIGSLLSLQKKSLDPPLRDVLLFPEERIQAMATAYRVSYASGEVGRVPVLMLVKEISGFLCQNAGRPVDSVAIDDRTERVCEISLDHAVPLAFLLTEVLSPVVRSPDGQGESPVSIVLEDEGENGCRLAFETPAAPEKGLSDERLHERLRSAFKMQLKAEVDFRRHDGRDHWSISFVVDDDRVAARPEAIPVEVQHPGPEPSH